MVTAPAAPHRAFIGLGSNLHDPVQQVRLALQRLAEIPQSSLVCASSLYRSKPLGPPDQPEYINAVAELVTELGAHALLDELQRIELAHGRTRDGERWGPRTLDLDLLMFDAQELRDGRLELPHPGLAKRAFVLAPLAEIAPDLRIPGLGRVADLRERFPAGAVARV